jgi:hypothetical protein
VKIRICLIAIACAAATAALVVSSATAATIKSYCIDGATASVSNDTAVGALDQFQLDTYASLGGAYTFKIGTGADAASLVDALGTLDYIVSPFSIPGGVFHPVSSGACAAGSPTPGDGSTATSVSTAPGSPDGIFLCYSRYQVDPGVWGLDAAPGLLAGGYWKPVAVAGIQSATRLGAYSLVCNPDKQAASAPAAAVDDGGGISASQDQLGALNSYVIAG